ncbi:MAG: ankyrin repeat domain-containing protein [Leptolyngbyaceae cyanobacterium bins.302]|nr:ankyrin repeat domain-containing protein [Leptolyngbyaceae cyanobacterium bins.302]
MLDSLTVVLEAIENNEIESLESLIVSGELDVNDTVEENTLLGLAAASGNLEVVQLFLANGANVDSPSENPDVTTALMDAVHSGNFEIVQLLVNEGASVNMIRDGGNFALKIAAEIGAQEIFNYLLPLTLPELQQEVEQTLSTKLPEYEVDELTTDFIDAVRRTDIRKIRQMIRSGVNVNALDEESNTALLYACQKGKFETVQLLLKSGADPNPLGAGMTPLMAAIGSGDKSIIKMLIGAGADVNAAVQGQTVLMQANTYSSYFNPKAGKEIIQLLVEAGAQ